MCVYGNRTTLPLVGHREDLLAAARRLLETKGFARITVRDLVAESGTSLASIGYHFGSKEGLLNEVIGTVSTSGPSSSPASRWMIRTPTYSSGRARRGARYSPGCR